MIRDRAKIAMVMAEFLGTAILTLVALSVSRTQGSTYFVALGVGLAIAAIVLTFGAISGAHCNPAITLGLLTTRRIKALPAVIYIAAQLLGGSAAYWLFTYFVNANMVNAGTFDSRILVAETAGAFIFSLGWAAQMYNHYSVGKAAFVVGGSLALGIIVASLASAGIVNPAVALGTRYWGWGTYALGPVLGSIIGFNLYALLFAPAKTLLETEALDEKRHSTK